MRSGISWRVGRHVVLVAATLCVLTAGLTLAFDGIALASTPELTIIQPSSGGATGDQTPTFVGTTTDTLNPVTLGFDPITLDVYRGTSVETSPVAELTALLPSQIGIQEDIWEATLEGAKLEQGQYTAVAEQTNSEAETGTSSPVTFTVETTPVVTLTAPTENAVLKSSEPTLEGSAGEAAWDESVAVTIHEGGSLTGSIVASGAVSVSEGKWSYRAPDLPDGVYTARATQTDGVDSTGTSQTVTFTLDTTPPALTLTVPTEDALLDEAEPTLAGRTGVDSWDYQSVTLTIHEGTSATGPVVGSPGNAAVSSGRWSYSTPHLNDGVYTARAEQSDEAGNTATVTVTFTVDATPPVVSMDALMSPTNNPTPSLAGEAGVASWDEPSVTVTIHAGDSGDGSVVGTPGSAAVNMSSGAWSYSVPHLSDGEYTAVATQSDEAGNTGKSNAVTFVLDTTPPALTLKTPAYGASLNVSRPMFSGLAGHASGDDHTVTLNVYDEEDDVLAAGPIELTPNEANEWTTGSTGPRLPNGIYVAVAEQLDDVGNVTRKTTTFTIDTTSPSVTLGTSGFVSRGAELLTGPAPKFSGTGAAEPEDSDSVVVNIYDGSSASGSPVRTVEAPLSGSTWATGPVEALPNGTYTVQAEQTDANTFSQTGVSSAVTFTVDASPPQVTLVSPSNGSSTTSSSQTVSGSAGTEEGDLPDVTVQLYAGSSVAGPPLESVTVGASEGVWSAVLGGLSPGTYTALAEQEDDVGNIGHSEPVTFTVLAPPVLETPSPPVASFSWFPAAPHTGEAISLVSTSTDASSAITSFGWALTGNDVFSAASSTISTSFATAGTHVVQLQVIDANGQSSVASETITVSPPVIPLMQPFPVVRIAGSFSSSGAKIGMLTVLAPVGATVRVTCRGGGCPAKAQRLRATAGAKSKASTVLITFHRFERSLRTGAVLDVWVSNAGKIGKFTRFVIRRNKPPIRTDMCLNPAGITPLVCPTS